MLGKTDFSGDPFIALSTEVTESLGGSENETVKTGIDRTMKLAKIIARRTLPSAIRFATAGLLDLETLLEKELAQALSGFAENEMSEYQKARKAMREFKESLQELANTLAESNGNRLLVVVIDELDRCRPSYAIELLEVAKHLFAVDRVVFVLALNRSELAHSVKTLYGGQFDGVGYLHRFFDVHFRLPEVDRAAFIDGALKAAQISDYFKRTSDAIAINGREEEFVRSCMSGFFGSRNFGLRQVNRAIHRLGLVFASLASNERSFAITAVVALIMRTVDLELYYEFVRGEATDLEVVDRVFKGDPWLRKAKNEYNRALFEAIVILAFYELSGARYGETKSPLLQRYTELVRDESSDAMSKNHGTQIISHFEAFKNGISLRFGIPDQRFGFKRTVERLELVSPGLIGETIRAPSTLKSDSRPRP